jgi:hypothetical protein
MFYDNLTSGSKSIRYNDDWKRNSELATRLWCRSITFKVHNNASKCAVAGKTRLYHFQRWEELILGGITFPILFFTVTSCHFRIFS